MAPASPVVDEDLLRDYAYHLYLHEGCIPGREMDVWREALACLRGRIPPLAGLASGRAG